MDFIMGEKLKNFNFIFGQKKITNIGPEYTKRCRIATFWGVCFLRKVDLVNIFYEIIMILGF